MRITLLGHPVPGSIAKLVAVEGVLLFPAVYGWGGR
jgi:hypothetical protein